MPRATTRGLTLHATGVYVAGRMHGRALLGVVTAIGEVGVAMSAASVRAGRYDLVRPRFSPPGTAAIFSSPLSLAPGPRG
jgi:hypothetical protein